ncbi:hypothetical protein P153DRAFT_148830 [Dothidotthia symphoricarpi CBS 119687]|uniref:Uncharacterized protein n=1 Tax=Dothidotthia symphoricarpi CBS 119687 TaxID=1392245 RepID=A0A6A5ZZ20_9PLEO|nr:uncharacterized protein P153DRAFT_148830 [Dothidotthia symphoricarpi CBS 119687]KAF2123658.1 hypothetical protein P153DRAFT_148830 [Dothidotthia symphoricarpi CBS 119687]
MAPSPPPAQPFVAHAVDAALAEFRAGDATAFPSFLALCESARDATHTFDALAAPDQERVERFWLEAAWFGVYAGSSTDALSVQAFEQLADLPLASLPILFTNRWRFVLRIAEHWGPQFWWTLERAKIPLLEREAATALATGLRPPIAFNHIDILRLPVVPSRIFLERLARIASSPSTLRPFLSRWPTFFADFLSTVVRKAHRLRQIAAGEYEIGSGELAGYLDKHEFEAPAQSLHLPPLPVVLFRARDRSVRPETEVARRHSLNSISSPTSPAPDHDTTLPDSPLTPRCTNDVVEYDEDITISDFGDSTIHDTTGTGVAEPDEEQLDLADDMAHHSAPTTRHNTPVLDMDARRHHSQPPAMPEPAPSLLETAEILKSVLSYGPPTTEMHGIADPVMNRLVSLFPEIIALHHARQRKSDARIHCLAVQEKIAQAEKEVSAAEPEHGALEGRLAEAQAKIATTLAAQETLKQPVNETLPESLKTMLRAQQDASIAAFASTLTQLQFEQEAQVTQVALSAQSLAHAKHALYALRDEAAALDAAQTKALDRCQKLDAQVRKEMALLVAKLERIVDCTEEFIPRNAGEEGAGKSKKARVTGANKGVARQSGGGPL